MDKILLFLALASVAFSLPSGKTRPGTQDRSEVTQIGFSEGDTQETDWWKTGQNEVRNAIEKTLRISQQIAEAKNVILFVGDGMGISTVTSARIYNAQTRELVGEDVNLSFENFPHIGLSKVYNTDVQVPDSAGTGTAMTCGVKAKSGTLGVNQNVYYRNCTNSYENRVDSYLHQAMNSGKWAGIVTTTRLTHATPASSYAFAGKRGWESDSDMLSDVPDPEDRATCPDIAYQLVHDERNQDLRVLLGGGRRNFMLNTQSDPEYGSSGYRLENDLIDEWLEKKREQNPENPEKYKYAWNQEQFDEADPEEVDYLLGLFEFTHMLYESERVNEPSLAEMTEKAIKMLQRGPDGFALLVEGGKIDLAHHSNRVGNSLREVLAFSDAIQVAADMTDESDTLIIVTADHSHSFTMNGSPYISNDIMGLVKVENRDHTELGLSTMGDSKPFTTLMYLNGPGYANHRMSSGAEVPRLDLTDEDELGTPRFRYDAAMDKSSETHSGEEVAIYARGPMSHLFHGTHEQNYIAHVLMYAACIGPNKDHCEKPREYPQCGPETK